MTDRYTFAPLLVDASPIPSRFAAPLDESAGGVTWLADGEWHRDEEVASDRRARVLLHVLERDGLVTRGPLVWRLAGGVA